MAWFSMRGLRLLVLSTGLCACGSTDDGAGTGSDGGGNSSGGSGQGNSGQGGTGRGGSGIGGPGGASSDCSATGPCCDDSIGTEVEWFCDSNNLPQCPSASSWPDEGSCVRRPGISCTSNDSCQEGQRCHFSDELCGAGAPGICEILPARCEEGFDSPICGCDGEIYDNTCEAAILGVDRADRDCGARDGDFACGSRFCKLGDYCELIVFDVAGKPVQTECISPPIGCGNAPSCACLSEEPCGDSCAADAQGNPTVTCQR